jgi:O-antigen/teichoic acid export membrane protein
VLGALYGNAFEDADTALVLLAPAIAAYPPSYVAGYLLVSQNRQRYVTLTYAAVAVENVLANLLLIPRFSLNGAAVGTSISELIVAASLLFFAQRTSGRIDWRRTFGSPVVASCLAAVAMAALSAQLALAIAAGAAVYVGVLILLEQLVFPGDAAALWNFVGRSGR